MEKNEIAMEPGNIAELAKRCSVSLMISGCLSYHQVGELVIVNDTIKGTAYIDILDQDILYSADKMFWDAMVLFIFQQDIASV
jgi:hypothetical protein